MAVAEVKPRPNAWSVGLSIGLGIALCEAVVVALAYRDLPLGGMARFLIVYLTGYAAVTGLLAGAFGSLAAAVGKRRPLPIALGVGVAWFVVIAYRGYRITRLCSWGAHYALPLPPAFAAALAGAAVIAVIAYFLGRSPAGRVPFALPASGLLVVVAVGAFLSRPEVAPAPPRALPAAATGPLVASPIDRASANILLISIDTLRADHTSPYGYVRQTSPHMQRLADRGVLFERCITQRTNTAPSVATLLTGTYPPTHRVFNNKDLLQDFNVTLAEMVAQEGYLTAAFCTTPAVGPHFNYQQGFAHFEMTADRREQEVQESRVVNQAVLEWLEANRSQRFFLWVHYKDPHSPYIVSEDYERLYLEDEFSGAHDHRQLPVGTKSHGMIRDDVFIAGWHDLDYYIAQYDAEIKFIDDSLGELFEALEGWGLWDNTVVVLTSDHGEGLGERNFFFAHGDYCNEFGAHVPLIFVHPQLRRGYRVTTPVSLTDVVPTLCELLALPLDPAVQGQSFAAALVEGAEFQMRPYHYILGSYRNGYQTHAVTTDRYKFIRDVDERWIYFDVMVEGLVRAWLGKAFTFHDKYRCRVIKHELYDLASDPAETVNLAGRGLPVEAELSANLWDWQESVYGAGESRPVAIGDAPEDVLEQLRALGYVE